MNHDSSQIFITIKIKGGLEKRGKIGNKYAPPGLRVLGQQPWALAGAIHASCIWRVKAGERLELQLWRRTDWRPALVGQVTPLQRRGT